MFKNIEKVYVLLMGNSLKSCKEDVNRISIVLRKNGIKHIYKKYDCFPFNEISSLIKKINFHSNDLLYIHYSGHGEIIGKKINNKVEMLSTWINPDKTYVNSYTIDKLLSKIKCKILLISDSCHSSEFGNHFDGNIIFIGSSSITKKSNEYKFNKKENAGIITCFLEYFFNKYSIKNLISMDINQIKNEMESFVKNNKIKIKPIFKIK